MCVCKRVCECVGVLGCVCERAHVCLCVCMYVCVFEVTQLKTRRGGGFFKLLFENHFFLIMIIEKTQFFCNFFQFFLQNYSIDIYLSIFFHKIMLTGFLSIMNMGIDIKTRFLSAMYAKILQKD